MHIPGLTEVLRLHRDFQVQFSEDILHDLTYNLREGYDPEAGSVAASVKPGLPSISEECSSPGSEAPISTITLGDDVADPIMNTLEKEVI